MNLTDILNWIVANQELLLTIVGLILAFLKSTSWGKANAKALVAVTQVIEDKQEKGLKQAVTDKVADLPNAVGDAIQVAVNTVDEKKPTPSSYQVILGELSRMFSPRK